MADVLIVTWEGGGVVQPAIGLGRELVARGHRVRILGPGPLADRTARAGCEHVSQPPASMFDPSQGRAMEDQDSFLTSTCRGPWFANATTEQIATRRPDVVIIDYFLQSTIETVCAAGIPVVLLVHMAHRFYAPQNLDLAARTIVTIPRAFDDWDDPPPNVVHVGPIAEATDPAPWVPPWPSVDRRPLVVVTLGTTYMHQEDILARIIAALERLETRVLVLTGNGLDPYELDIRPDVCVEQYVPHDAVLPQAALMVTHAGMGSILGAFAAGLPSVCIPLGRDQHVNATAAQQLGAAITLPASATIDEIRDAITNALTSSQARLAAQKMASALATCGGAQAAADEVEQVMSTPIPALTVRLSVDRSPAMQAGSRSFRG